MQITSSIYTNTNIIGTTIIACCPLRFPIFVKFNLCKVFPNVGSYLIRSFLSQTWTHLNLTPGLKRLCTSSKIASSVISHAWHMITPMIVEPSWPNWRTLAELTDGGRTLDQDGRCKRLTSPRSGPVTTDKGWTVARRVSYEVEWWPVAGRWLNPPWSELVLLGWDEEL